ncbi:MAG TPA: hypothetical protein VMT18_02550 [Planctomycetota bacterium]|nr:hypothetical protein [Planctomycetota bacterium]
MWELERIFSELRLLSEHARASRVEPFRESAERMLAAPWRLEFALRSVQSSQRGAEDLRALSECVSAAIASYAAARTSGYYGAGFDPNRFFDLVVETLPSLPPEAVSGLLLRLSQADVLSGKHAWMCRQLTQVSGVEADAWNALLHLQRRGDLPPESLEELLESRGQEDGLPSLRGAAWCAQLDSDADGTLPRATERLVSGGLGELELGVLAGCLAEHLPASNAMTMLERVLDETHRTEPRTMELFQRFRDTELSALAAQALGAELDPVRRCHYLAILREDIELLEVVELRDASLAVRCWARFFHMHALSDACAQRAVLAGFVDDLLRSPRDEAWREGVVRLASALNHHSRADSPCPEPWPPCVWSGLTALARSEARSRPASRSRIREAMQRIGHRPEAGGSPEASEGIFHPGAGGESSLPRSPRASKGDGSEGANG